MKGKPVLNRISEPIKGMKVVYNGEWGKNVIYTIVETYTLQYFDLQNKDLLTYKDIFSAHISELSQIAIEYISEEEITNPVVDKEYYNLYDGRVWKYRPSPCPMPFWANTKTLREIKQTPLATDDYEAVMAGGHCGHCADVEASKHITEKCSAPACMFVSDGSIKKEVEFELEKQEHAGTSLWYLAKLKK